MRSCTHCESVPTNDGWMLATAPSEDMRPIRSEPSTCVAEAKGMGSCLRFK